MSRCCLQVSVHLVGEMRGLWMVSACPTVIFLCPGRCVLAAEGSIRGGAPRPGFAAMAVVNRSGASSPAEGGGDGMGALGAIREAAVSTSRSLRWKSSSGHIP